MDLCRYRGITDDLELIRSSYHGEMVCDAEIGVQHGLQGADQHCRTQEILNLINQTIMLTREQRDELDSLVKLAGGEVSQVARAALTEGMVQVRRRLTAAEAS